MHVSSCFIIRNFPIHTIIPCISPPHPLRLVLTAGGAHIQGGAVFVVSLSVFLHPTAFMLTTTPISLDFNGVLGVLWLHVNPFSFTCCLLLFDRFLGHVMVKPLPFT